MKWLDRIRKLFNLQPKGVSEPVISFVKCFLNKPKRFEIKPIHFNLYSVRYNLIDLSTKESWKFSIATWKYDGYPASLRFYPEFLSSQEANYIYEAIEGYYSERRERLNKLKKIRSDRLKNKIRDRLTSVYKEE